MARIFAFPHHPNASRQDNPSSEQPPDHPDLRSRRPEARREARPQADFQYRHHRARRPRQNHPGRRHAAPVRDLPGERGRCRARHGLQRPRARARHHDSGQKYGSLLPRQQDQYRRHPWPRRLRRRSRARAEDGRRRRSPRRRVRRPAAADALRALEGARSQADPDADEDMLDFPVLYTNGKVGTATKDLATPGTDLQPLFEQIIQTIPTAKGDPDGPVQILVTNLDYSDYLGRLAIARVFNGTMRTGQEYNVARVDGSFSKHKITKLFSFSGLKRTDIEETQIGDIVAIAGIPGITIGESFCDVEDPQPLPPIKIDEPTIAIQFNVNNSPFAGREGKWVTSRNLRDRLDNQLLPTVPPQLPPPASPATSQVR